MHYKFTQSLMGLDFAFHPGQVIDESVLSPQTIQRLLERGMLMPHGSPDVRAPEKQKAISRRQKVAEKAVL